MSVFGVDELNRGTFDVAPVIRTLSGASALSTVLKVEGTYYLYADADCFWIQAGSDGTVTTSTGNPLPAKQFLGPIKPTKDDTTANGGTAYIAAITTGGTGNLYIIRAR